MPLPSSTNKLKLPTDTLVSMSEPQSLVSSRASSPEERTDFPFLNTPPQNSTSNIKLGLPGFPKRQNREPEIVIPDSNPPLLTSSNSKKTNPLSSEGNRAKLHKKPPAEESGKGQGLKFSALSFRKRTKSTPTRPPPLQLESAQMRVSLPIAAKFARADRLSWIGQYGVPAGFDASTVEFVPLPGNDVLAKATLPSIVNRTVQPAIPPSRTHDPSPSASAPKLPVAVTTPAATSPHAQQSIPATVNVGSEAKAEMKESDGSPPAVKDSGLAVHATRRPRDLPPAMPAPTTPLPSRPTIVTISNRTGSAAMAPRTEKSGGAPDMRTADTSAFKRGRESPFPAQSVRSPATGAGGASKKVARVGFYLPDDVVGSRPSY